MATYKTPGVYIEEISIFPPSVAQVETAIPVFIGLTEKSEDSRGNNLEGIPTKIKSLVDYRLLFGGPHKEVPTFNITGTGTTDDPHVATPAATIPATPENKMYYALVMYFANGGGPCYIQSIGAYGSGPDADKYSTMLTNVKKEDEPTLFVFPDLTNSGSPFYDVLTEALQQCADLGDRFLICDVKEVISDTDPAGASATPFRTGIGTSNLMYGASYYPFIQTSLTHVCPEEDIVIGGIAGTTKLRVPESTFDGLVDPALSAAITSSLFHASNGIYKQLYYDIKKMISEATLLLPPSPAIAGIYAAVDSTRGVWKAPANVSLNRVTKPNVILERSEQDGLNVDVVAGKSINAIRFFNGKGSIVWGARTMDGNSNEWRYISVRRFFNMVEESVKKATEFFVFEPNDANTWVKVKAMIDNFLTLQWRQGALMGAKPEEAFFVKVGLGETMSEDDVLNGRLIVEIGMAAVRPAEFIILKFSHKMIES